MLLESTMDSPCTISSPSHHHPAHNQESPWPRRTHSFESTYQAQRDNRAVLYHEPSPGPNPIATPKERWWRIKLFRGMIRDVRRRAPFYGSDWRDAWTYRVIPATVYIYFAKYASWSTQILSVIIPLSLCHHQFIYVNVAYKYYNIFQSSMTLYYPIH